MSRLFQLIISAFRSNHNHNDYRLPPSLSDDDNDFDHSLSESSSLLEYNNSNSYIIVVDNKEETKTTPANIYNDNIIQNSIIDSNSSQIADYNFNEKMSTINNHQNSDSSNR